MWTYIFNMVSKLSLKYLYSEQIENMYYYVASCCTAVLCLAIRKYFWLFFSQSASYVKKTAGYHFCTLRQLLRTLARGMSATNWKDLPLYMKCHTDCDCAIKRGQPNENDKISGTIRSYERNSPDYTSRFPRHHFWREQLVCRMWALEAWYVFLSREYAYGHVHYWLISLNTYVQKTRDPKHKMWIILWNDLQQNFEQIIKFIRIHTGHRWTYLRLLGPIGTYRIEVIQVQKQHVRFDHTKLTAVTTMNKTTAAITRSIFQSYFVSSSLPNRTVWYGYLSFWWSCFRLLYRLQQ